MAETMAATTCRGHWMYLVISLIHLLLYDVTSATSTTAAPEGGEFFDDDNNLAMFVVLPCIVLVYGGCSLIYCVHKCRRYCRKKTKRPRDRPKSAVQIESVRMPFTGPDAESPGPSCSGGGEGKPPVVLTLEEIDETEGDPVQDHKVKQTETTFVDSLDDVLADSDKGKATTPVSPGYGRGNLSQEMQHLDLQLQAAFKMAHTDGVKLQNASTQTSDSDFEAKAKILKKNGRQEDQELLIEPTSTTSKSRSSKAVKRSKDSVNNGDVPKEDLLAMAKVRAAISAKQNPSQPDVVVRDDENSSDLKKYVMKGWKKKKFFLGSEC